jgi:iron-sulfur cluster repair protein YtfE (RIC family)
MTRTDAISAKLSDTVSSFLGHDHERLDVLLAEARRSATMGRIASARETFVAFATGLSQHIQAEEAILFPAFDVAVPMRGPTTVMMREHRAIDQLMARARAALEDNDGARFDSEAASVEELLRSHNAKEERVLYPTLDANLDEVARTELLERLRHAM